MTIALDDFKKQAFFGTYYGQNSKYLLQFLPKINANDLKEYYENILNPENLVISIAGNVDEKQIASKLNAIFKPKKSKKIIFKEEKMVSFLPQENIISKIKKTDTQTAWVVLGYKTAPLFNQKDTATLKVINAIMGEGMSSRLFKSLREEQGLAYIVGSSVTQNLLDGAYFAYIGTNNQSVDKAKEGMIAQIDKLKSEYVSKKELQEAKEKILGNLIISLETNMDFASVNGFYAVTERPLNQLEEYKKLISEVSQSDILEFANKYFSKPYICTIVSAND